MDRVGEFEVCVCDAQWCVNVIYNSDGICVYEFGQKGFGYECWWRAFWKIFKILDMLYFLEWDIKKVILVVYLELVYPENMLKYLRIRYDFATSTNEGCMKIKYYVDKKYDVHNSIHHEKNYILTSFILEGCEGKT